MEELACPDVGSELMGESVPDGGAMAKRQQNSLSEI